MRKKSYKRFKNGGEWGYPVSLHNLTLIEMLSSYSYTCHINKTVYVGLLNQCVTNSNLLIAEFN